MIRARAATTVEGSVRKSARYVTGWRDWSVDVQNLPSILVPFEPRKLCHFYFCDIFWFLLTIFYRTSAGYACRAQYCCTYSSVSLNVRPSAHLSVWPMPVLYLNECTNRHNFFDILVVDRVFEPQCLYRISRETPSAGTLNTRLVKTCKFVRTVCI